MMVVFIALPLIFVFIQSFLLTQEVFEEVKVQSCTPGFTRQVCTEEVKQRPVLGPDGKPLKVTAFVGFENYRLLLQPEAVSKAFSNTGEGIGDVLKIDFYRASFCITLLILPSSSIR